MLERRNLLRGLVSLPLIGGGVTLIGRPAARVPLTEVAVAPLLDDPRQRARYAWEAFSAAMRDVTAGADGWRVQGGEDIDRTGKQPRGVWMDMRSIHKVPLYSDVPRGGTVLDRLTEIDLA